MIEDAPIWRAIRILASTTTDPGCLLEDALLDIEGLEAAFIFGSVASGEQRDGSDIDLLVVEAPDVDRKKLLRQLGEVGLVLGRGIGRALRRRGMKEWLPPTPPSPAPSPSRASRPHCSRAL